MVSNTVVVKQGVFECGPIRMPAIKTASHRLIIGLGYHSIAFREEITGGKPADGEKDIFKILSHTDTVCQGEISFLDKIYHTDSLKWAHVFTHQEMLSALVTKRYHGLTDEQRRYWNSVY